MGPVATRLSLRVALVVKRDTKESFSLLRESNLDSPATYQSIQPLDYHQSFVSVLCPQGFTTHATD